jgi:hypothetical protein
LKNYFIFPARLEEVHEGLVWIKDASISERTVIKITDIKTSKNVFCEALPIDATDKYYFRKSMGKNFVIFMNGRYRKMLGHISHNRTHRFSILKANKLNGIWYWIMAGLNHPQTIVKINLLFALISITLTFSGVVLSIIFWIWPYEAFISYCRMRLT